MNVPYIAQVATSAIALAVVMTAVTANAQSDVTKAVQAKLAAGTAKLESSCGDEIKSFCSTVTPGQGRMVLCIEAHEDKLSPKCQFDMHEAANNLRLAGDSMKEATTACQGDVGKLCGQTKAGQGRILECLMTNKAAISPACAASLQKLSDFSSK
jgi:hypothetical protein